MGELGVGCILKLRLEKSSSECILKKFSNSTLYGSVCPPFLADGTLEVLIIFGGTPGDSRSF